MIEKVRCFVKTMRPFVKPFLVVFLIYAFAMLAVWRSGVSFVDDRGRAIFGYAWTSDFNRFSSTAFGLAMNVNDRLLDISPWPQILAMGILSVVSVMLVYVFCDKKIKYLPLVLTAFFGLLPLTVECWLYKFDAPCIALAVFVSVLPILWWPKELTKKAILKFGAVTMICMLVMWTTYQAASGIFPVVVLYMAVKEYLAEKKWKLVVKKVALAVVWFVVPALMFKFLLPEPVKSYRTNEMLALADLIPGILRNFGAHIELMVRSLNIWQKILVAMTGVTMTALIVYKYRVKSVIILIAFLVAVPLSIGAYLLLEEPPLTPRSLVGVGMAFVPLMVMATNGIFKTWQFVCAAPSLVLLYSFMMFVLALSNGLSDQERWANYRVEDLVSGLSELYPDADDVAARKIKIAGDIGYSKVMQHVAEKYPAATEIVTFQQTGLSYAAWGLTKVRSYYNRYQEFEENYAYAEYCGEDVEMVKDTYYYTIRDNGDHVCVDLK